MVTNLELDGDPFESVCLGRTKQVTTEKGEINLRNSKEL